MHLQPGHSIDRCLERGTFCLVWMLVVVAHECMHCYAWISARAYCLASKLITFDVIIGYITSLQAVEVFYLVKDYYRFLVPFVAVHHNPCIIQISYMHNIATMLFIKYHQLILCLCGHPKPFTLSKPCKQPWNLQASMKFKDAWSWNLHGQHELPRALCMHVFGLLDHISAHDLQMLAAHHRTPTFRIT